MKTDVISAINTGIMIKPVNRLHMKTREERRERHTSKKKSDTLFSEVLSGEIDSAADQNRHDNKSEDVGIIIR